MATYRSPAIYVWTGTEWVLTLATWNEASWFYTQAVYYSTDGANWTTGNY